MKTKALFEIFLVITLSFFISLSFASQDVSAQVTSCCAKAKSGEFCVEGLEQDQCEEGYAPTSCDLSPSCSTKGCCEVDRRCSYGSSAASCDANEGIFYPGQDCGELDQCQQSCCVIGNNCALKTSYQCEQAGGDLNHNIRDERGCINSCNQFKFGCCVDEGKCNYGIGQGCENFIEGVECSRTSECGEQCEAEFSTDCGEDGHVYWYDSCGNKERVKERCNPTGAGGATTNCVDTDDDGTGDSCGSWDCTDVWDNPVVDENGNCPEDAVLGNACYNDDRIVRKHKESWCQYQAAVGPSLDLPGTQHFKHWCWKGKEVVEPCSSDREEICVYGEASSLYTGERKSIGTCVKNNWKPCVQCEDQQCCEASENNCFWSQGETALSLQEIEDTGRFKVRITVNYQTQKRDDLEDDWDDEKGYVTMNDDGDFELGSNDEVCEDSVCDSLIISGPESVSLSFGNAVADQKQSPENNPLRKYTLYTFEPELPEGEYSMKIYNPHAAEIFGEDREFELPPLSLSLDRLAELTKNQGSCMPLVASESTDKCSEASFQGDKKQKEISYWEDGFFGVGDLECEGGCEVYREPDFKLGANSLCNSYGKCGASYNLAGKFSNKGFSRDCRVGNEYENIESECPAGSDKLTEEELPFSRFETAGVGLKLLSFSLNDPGGEGFFDYWYGETLQIIGGLALVSSAAAILTISTVTYAFGLILGSVAWVPVIGLFLAGLAAIVFALGSIGQNSEHRDIGSNCGEWLPPDGGDDCGKCHLTKSEGGLLPDVAFARYDASVGDIPSYTCTKQLCTSLGSHCELKSTVEGEQCVAIPPNDIQEPRIEVDNVLYVCNDESPGQVGGCSSDENQRLSISGELKEFSTLNITLKTVNPETNEEEFAVCVYNEVPGESFETSQNYFKEGFEPSKKHTLDIKNIGQDKEYNLYVFCEDISSNRNKNLDAFTLTFKVALEPDLTAPVITGYNPPRGEAFTAYDKTSLPITLELNEEVLSTAGCRWSREPDLAFNNMTGAMSCSAGGLEAVPKCEGVFTGLEPDDTEFYFKCRDTIGNTHQQDWPSEGPYVVSRSGPLNITDLACPHFENDQCNEVIYDKNITFRFRTVGGAEDNGYSTCNYRINNGNAIELFTTGESNHKQEGLTPGREGDFKLDIVCTDLAGNIAKETATLKMRIDSNAPRILNTYSLGGTLHLRTSEKARCSYATNSTNLLDQEMSTGNGLIHDVSADTNLYKVRCKDRFENAGEFLNVHILEKK